MQVIGMHIGSSFAEVCLHSDQKPHFLYLPRQNLKSSLPKIISGRSFEAAYISNQFLEKLFEFRLGGSTAQIVTAGCEKWPFLSVGAAQQGWIEPAKCQPIASQELSFPIRERIDSNGKVLTELQTEDLTPILEKLKAQEIKRVCIHLLNASHNPIHQNQIQEYFKSEGMDVFVPTLNPHLDEIEKWRRSTLEASFSGTFEEIRSEIEKGLEGITPAEKIFMRDQSGFIPSMDTSRVGSLFGLDELLLERFPHSSSILDLGLESWRLIHRKPQKHWKSPWGKVEVPISERIDLKCQPTSLLEKVASGDVVILKKKAGYEPGPLSFGRGQKFLVFDLYTEELSQFEGIQAQMSESGTLKKENYLKTLCRNSKVTDPKQLIKQLRTDVVDSIAWDVQVHDDESPLVLHGVFSSIIGPELQRRMPERKILINPKLTSQHLAQVSAGELQ